MKIRPFFRAGTRSLGFVQPQATAICRDIAMPPHRYPGSACSRASAPILCAMIPSCDRCPNAQAKPCL